MAHAATDLVSDLAASGKARFGLVPFSHHVYLSMPNKYVMGKGLIGTYVGCTQDRRDPYNLTDTLPDTADESSKWGQPQARRTQRRRLRAVHEEQAHRAPDHRRL